MGYEVMRLLQFVFSICLVLGAFGGGLLLGWHRWGREESLRAQRRSTTTPASAADPLHEPVATSGGPAAMCSECGAPSRQNLFAPEFSEDPDLIDLVEHEPEIRGELPSGAWTRG